VSQLLIFFDSAIKRHFLKMSNWDVENMTTRRRGLAETIGDTPLARNLWRILRDRGLTDLTALAEMTGTRRTMLRSILTGKSRSSTGDNLRKIADGIGINVCELLYDPEFITGSFPKSASVAMQPIDFTTGYTSHLLQLAYEAAAEWYRSREHRLSSAQADAAKFRLATSLCKVLARLDAHGANLYEANLSVVVSHILEIYALGHLQGAGEAAAQLGQQQTAAARQRGASHGAENVDPTTSGIVRGEV
jgi:hypothetical protein